MSKENSLFKTDRVRDLISELYNASKDGKVPSIKAMDYTLYSELGAFMDTIADYDTVDKRNTLKNYLVGIICSDNKYNSDDMKMQKVDAFIASVNRDPDTDQKKSILTAMAEIKGKLPKMLENTSPDKCKAEIVTTLGDYFKTNALTEAEVAKHESLKAKILAAPYDDRKLFLNFADFVKCDVSDDNCNEISTIETSGTRFNLRKKNGDEIVLLDLFSGSKDVSIVMSKENLSMVEKITNLIYDYIKVICVSIALMMGLYLYNHEHVLNPNI